MLKPKQKMLAELMASEPSLRMVDYAERCNISEKSVYVYKRNPEFQEYLSELCKERFKFMEALAIQKIYENVNKNNQKAIEYVLDGLGYKPKEQQEIQMDTNITIDYGD